MNEKTVLFLSKAVNCIPSDSPGAAVIKSHFISKCKRSALKHQVTLSKSSFGPHILCDKCGNPWKDVEKIRIQPKLKKTNHKDETVLKKFAKPGSKLEKYQERIRKDRFSKVVRTCSYCKNTKKSTIIRPNAASNELLEPKSPKSSTSKKSVKKKAKLGLEKQIQSNHPKVVATQSIKKKKKKDKFAGLNPNAVRQALKTDVKVQPSAISNQTVSQKNKLAKALKNNPTNKSKLLNLFKN